MNRRVALTILRCLRVSGDSDSAIDSLRRLSEHDWRRAIPWLDSSCLTLYFRQQIEQSNALPMLPPAARSHLERAGRDHRTRAHEMFEEFQTLIGLLESARVPYAVLKGFSLVPDYCPGPALRVQYDHDFLIHSSGVERVDDALRAAGYRRKAGQENCAALYLPLSMRIPTGPVNPYSSELARPVEIHWGLWDRNDDGVDLAFPDGVFERIEWHEFAGIRFPALSDEDALLFQVLHAFRHILHNWCRLSVFLELAYLLARRTRDTEFWEAYAARLAGDPRLADVSAMVFTLAARLFGAPLPAPFRLRPESQLSAVLAAWVARYGVTSALGNFRGNKFSLFLHREFVGDAREWRKIQRRRLFPLQRPNRLPEATGAGLSDQALSRSRQLRHSLERIRHHLARAARYGWEYPAWRRARKEAALSSQASARHAAEAAPRERPKAAWEPSAHESP